MANGSPAGAEVTSNDPPPASSQNDIQPGLTSSNPPITSSLPTENGQSKRPRDARLLHLILTSYGVTAYQERVPLQLMDFAYRYTSSTLQDALHLTSEGYGTAPQNTTGRAPNVANDMSAIGMPSLRLSIASRTHYQFNPTLPKEFYQEIAQERNRIALPSVGKEMGVRLPPEQYCLTGIGWGLKNEWESEGEEEEGEAEDLVMEGQDDGEDGDGDEEDGGRMEDVFGTDMNGDGEDREMEDG